MPPSGGIFAYGPCRDSNSAPESRKEEQNRRQNDADQDTRPQGKIEREVFAFIGNIAGQSPQRQTCARGHKEQRATPAQSPIQRPAAFFRVHSSASYPWLARPGPWSLPFHFIPISRMRAVNARPCDSLKVPYCGESTTLFTTAGFWLPVAFSITPRSPQYCP